MNNFYSQKSNVSEKNKIWNIMMIIIILEIAFCLFLSALALPLSAQTKRSIYLTHGLNFFGFPLKVPYNYTSHNLIKNLGLKDEVIKIQKHDSYTNTFITTMYDQNGDAGGDIFAVIEGEGYLVYMKDSTIANFTETPATSEIFCKEGLNIISIPGIAPGYTSYDLLPYLGNPNEIMYLKGLDKERGAFDTTLYCFGKPSGKKFEIKNGEAYLAYMKKPKLISTKKISDPNSYPIETVLTNFTALPNIVQITEDPNEKNTSSFCYGCHNGRVNNQWTKAGALPIFGDDVGEKRKEHHPMGNQASLKDHFKSPNGIFVRAPGTKLEYLNQNLELTCTSCHDNFHGPGHYKDQPDAKRKNKMNHFLRWQFVNIYGGNNPQDTDPNEDNETFCIECHSDKNNLSGKHLQNRATAFARSVQRVIYIYDPNSGIVKKKVGCANCMFCHFIHDGDERQSINPDQSIDTLVIWPDVDSLIRVSPLPLSWGEQNNDSDSLDYEDLCYGCHGEKEIVENTGQEGSRLDPEHYYTHPFSVEPSFIFDPNFPVSDGKGINIPDDYGVNEGYMYCGTCHDVHDNRATPYLIPILSFSGGYKSPYNYKDEGFCESCHEKDEFVAKSHPIGVDPNPDPTQGSPTKDEFTDFYTTNPVSKYLFNQGGSGRPGGITAPYDVETSESTDGSKGKIICLTCHNTHAAATSWDGKIKNDPYKNHGALLVKDNMKVWGAQSFGSDLCKACHPFNENDKFPTGNHGAGTLSGAESGICNVCHTPHNAAGQKLWAREGYGAGPFTGERQICFTCHNKRGIARTGRETVFKGIGLGDSIPVKYLEDHVMRQWADVTRENVFVDQNYFPLDPNDIDTIPDPNNCSPHNPSAEGFYCGSCHNPHIQKGDRYLRGIEGPGYPLNRKGFCKQCHISFTNCPGGERECLECHHPHKGKIMFCEDPNIGSKIYFKLAD